MYKDEIKPGNPPVITEKLIGMHRKKCRRVAFTVAEN